MYAARFRFYSVKPQNLTQAVTSPVARDMQSTTLDEFASHQSSMVRAILLDFLV
jgi:hypothetical protein